MRSHPNTPGNEQFVEAEREHLLLSVFVVRADAVTNPVGSLIRRVVDVCDDVAVDAK